MKKLIVILIIHTMCIPMCIYAIGVKDINTTTANTVSQDRREFTDSANRVVNVPNNIQRAAPSGALSQYFIAAIAPDLLCAVSAAPTDSELEYIPLYKKPLPVIGALFGAANLNKEELARINPDVIIDIGESKSNIDRDMDNITSTTQIPSIHIEAELETTPAAFRALGKLLKREEKGEALAQYCEKVLAYKKYVEDNITGNKRKVLYCLGKNGQNVLARGSFHSEVLDALSENLAVVNNISSRGSGNETDLEQIALWNPEIILFNPESIYNTVGRDKTWSTISAIKSNSFFEVPSGPYNWMGSPPSINRFPGVLWLCKLLYPQYSNYNLYDEVREYYKLFYDYDLEIPDYNMLTINSIGKYRN